MKNFVQRIKKLKALLVKASDHKSYPRQIYEIIQHKLVINVNPIDYYLNEFYREGKTLEEKSRYVILGGSRYWPYENTPFKFTITLSNKYIQKTLLKGFNLPTPAILAIVGDDHAIKTRDQLNDFLDANEQDIVIKPVSGAQGKNILVATKKEKQYFLADRPVTYDDLWGHLKGNLKNDYLIEEKVNNHPSMARINPSCLNTYRVITIKTNDNKWHFAACSAKFGQGGSFVDNAMSGGILVGLDHNGISTNAYDALRNQNITHHPDTGACLTGIRFEGYQQVKELALHASEKFFFMGTIGWDIAYTDKGAMIIEGNTSYSGQLMQSGRDGMITDEIAKGLRQHHAFGRWDKTKLYPRWSRKPWWSWKR
ncbi:MAG: hypothetical protein IPK65_10110 [Gammaproteobacteria bacterium]|nr:hypothetical protein [Gammaproteobacteria bacterium]